ncbi:MAG: DUF5753 domain-containing protein [Streptosporangiaceae bacterium]
MPDPPVGPPEEGPEAAPVRLVPAVGRHRSPGHGPALIRAARRLPGLLQTEEYARAILSARPDGNLDDLDEQVAARLARQAILDRTGAPQLWCILDEGVLHRAIGGSKVMRSHLYHLAEVAEHPKTTIQVIRSGGTHAGLLAHFVIADLDGKPPVVYLETAAEGQVTDSSSAVGHGLAAPRGPGRRVRPSSGASSTKASCTAPSAAARSCEASSTAWPK